MAGVAIGAAVVMALAALAAWLFVRGKRDRQTALDPDKHDSSSTASSRRRVSKYCTALNIACSRLPCVVVFCKVLAAMLHVMSHL